MTRGNQRDKAREKAQKKKGEVEKKKKAEASGNLDDRRQRDADIMREKQQKAATAAGATAK